MMYTDMVFLVSDDKQQLLQAQDNLKKLHPNMKLMHKIVDKNTAQDNIDFLVLPKDSISQIKIMVAEGLIKKVSTSLMDKLRINGTYSSVNIKLNQHE